MAGMREVQIEAKTSEVPGGRHHFGNAIQSLLRSHCMPTIETAIEVGSRATPTARSASTLTKPRVRR